ncbi:MAG: family 65 glycosyl hydrolase domain-containing protein [Saprospiraceae bacterium]|nr:family 65 glycosyl hydrolase domain-containing protein [Saprospiraceae bacterium]
MKNYITHDPWRVVENGWNAEHNEVSESLCAIGNGRMGHRANFEETYTGKTLKGSYVAGVYYPDKTKVGWWKNGYPEYFAKVLNAPSWIGIQIEIDGEELDLATGEVLDFQRILDMQHGFLERSATVKMASGKIVKIHSKRFCSLVDDECGAIRYALTAVNFSGKISITNSVDADVSNKDTNWDEKFWNEVTKLVKNSQAVVVAATKKTDFHVATGMKFRIFVNGKENDEFVSFRRKRDKYAACTVDLAGITEGSEIVVYKYAAVLSSENHPKETLLKRCQEVLKKFEKKTFEGALTEQKNAWLAKWDASDIEIAGDIAAQQGIRFNIFHLNQTYTGEDDRLNIGPKGFTGEKYGGSTYWDTEAYCLPFYLVNADEKVARNLLVYRYKHLQKAIENAQKLGFTHGAALYPMVTINGEECHNEWEITFEEIHRNGAIAYAIFDYINYTDDKKYLSEFGLEVLIGIARFWAQRVHFSTLRNQYVMHGVTGPNEYENNINNNWYTSYIARWCMQYAAESLAYVEENHRAAYNAILEKTNFNTQTELAKWKDICDNLFLPSDEKLGVFLQQDNYLDKELLTVNDLTPEQRPINQKWSWDRILRSCFIKQADVLQGLYLFEDDFDVETHRRNFEFYEPRTVHESSLSPCVHVILACLIGNYDKAMEMYLRTSRLDLDDYNNDTEDGLHITSMAGTWMSVVKGFGGMRVKNGVVHFNPYLPEAWDSMSFKVRFRGASMDIKVSKSGIEVENLGSSPIEVMVRNSKLRIEGGATATV